MTNKNLPQSTEEISYLKLLFTYTKNLAQERGISKARVFFLRSLLYSVFSSKWMKFIDQYYKQQGFVQAPWTLVGLPIRSYVVLGLSITQKISLLTNHHLLLAEFLKPKLLKRVLQGEIIELSQLTAKDGNVYSINITILDRYWREGGLTIFMVDKSMIGKKNFIITTLTFNFGKKDNGDIFIIIGGLQGTPLGKEKIVSTTRMLNGLRPKYAVLEALYAIASAFNIDSIVATSNTNHVFGKTKLAKKIHSDYDNFWLEIGGIKDKDNNFQLPLALPKRSLEEVQSKRKKDWLKRQEYLEQIKTDSRACLQT